mgnify:CR=1 FL=1
MRSCSQIKALAKNGGVIGLSAMSQYISDGHAKPTIDDLIRHIDHIAELVGIDYVGLGPDHFEGEIWTDRGWDPAPGYLEGLYVGQSEGSAFVDGFEDITKFPTVTEALVRHGYSDKDIKKVLGENFIRVYRQVLG